MNIPEYHQQIEHLVACGQAINNLEMVLPQLDPESCWLWDYLHSKKPFSIADCTLIYELICEGFSPHQIAEMTRHCGIVVAAKGLRAGLSLHEEIPGEFLHDRD